MEKGTQEDHGTEKSTENPFFWHYGRLTERCFSEDLLPGAPVSVFPRGISGIGTGAGGDGHRTAHLALYADKEQLAFVQKSVDRLREGLAAEVSSAGNRRSPSVTLQFAEFKNALASGREAMLNENPFYELTGLIFRLNQVALKNAFIAYQKSADVHLPGAIKVSRTLKHLWGREGSMISQKEKIQETLGKVLSVGKVVVGVFLFLTSSLTTAKAISDIVQDARFIRLFGTGLDGSDNETLRLLVSLLVGFAFSSVILDFKGRIFQCIAEAGHVFGGVWQAFRRFPRWMFISLFLTAFSIYTNYEGIVLIFSKTQDLSYQWGKIEKQVVTALGDLNNTDESHPDSLADLSAVMERTVADAVAKFEQVPIDEGAGTASSGQAIKGPRYWAKYYIVAGGYQPGVRDVVTAYKPSTAASEIDKLLAGATLDLTLPIQEKLQAITARYAAGLAQTREEVSQDMALLHRRMVMDDYSLGELQSVFQLEAYHVNESVAAIVKKLEADKNAFAAASQELHKVVEEHVALLVKMDHYGIPTQSNYSIDISMVVPKVDAIDQLKEGSITKAKRRTLAELRSFLFEVYGAFLGTLILGLVLFIAVFMDLSDPILYSAMVARWGRRDRHFLEDNQQRFLLWEEAYVRRLRSFFVRPEIRPAMHSLACPGQLVFTHAFHDYLENIFPHTKDLAQRTSMEKIRFWFAELFSNTRMVGVIGYNNRHLAIRRFIKQKETHAPRLINSIFPGLMETFTPGSSHFDTLRHTIVVGQERLEKRFWDELEAVKKAMERRSALETRGASAVGTPQSSVAVSSPSRGMTHWLRLLLVTSFGSDPESCPLTRLSWMQRMVTARFKTASSQLHLASFSPILKEWLVSSKFPHLRESTLEPLERRLQSIPNRRMIEEALGIGEILAQLDTIHRTLTEILGLSMFRGDVLDTAILHAILTATGVPEIPAVFLDRTSDISILEKRLEGIRNQLDSMHRVLVALVENQDAVVEVLTRIRTHHLSPMNAILEKMENRTFFEKSLRLDVLFRDLTNMERFMMRLWDASYDVASDSDREGIGVEDARANPMLRYLICDNGKSQLTLLEKMGQLETHAEQMHKKLNATIFVLTFVDKLAVKVRGQLEEILDMQHAIMDIDRRNKGGVRGIHPSLEPRLMAFMDNNRLFFMSIQAKVNTMFEKIDALLQDPAVAESHNVELFRGLESRTFKLHQFMKQAQEFFDGRRDRLELPPSLSFAGSGVSGHPAGLPDDPLAVNDAFAGDVSSPEAIGRAIKRIRVGLREISLVEWDLLKLPIPPQSVMEIFEENKRFIEHAWVEVERMQAVLDGDSGGGVPVEFPLLGEQSQKLADTLEQLWKRVDVLPVVDRRLAKDYPVHIEAGRRAGDAVVDEICHAKPNPSRRSLERVVAFHPVELRFAGVGTFKGVLQDVSKTGACIETDQPPSSLLRQEMAGTIRVVSDKQENKINCRVKRLTGHMLGLQIDEASQSAFAAVVRREITGGKGGVV
ncbi:MAG: PilZ domain-containing protein [Magnetococcales bacterium]|nr:PilZ domain-containing protein [Magnetococcales bacterium]